MIGRLLKDLLPSLRALLAFGSLCVLTGCAGILNGTRQPIEITSDRPHATVRVQGADPIPLPATVELLRDREYPPLLIVFPRPKSSASSASSSSSEPSESSKDSAQPDTTRVQLERKLSGLIWTNLLWGFYGLPGLGFDYLTGGGWRFDVVAPSRVPAHLHVNVDVDPWRTGTWKGSLALFAGTQGYADGVLPEGRLGADVALQGVAGRRDWPLEIETRIYLLSSLRSAGSNVIAEGGLRKTWLDDPRLRPYVAGGVSVLSRATDPGGLPVGAWGRVGLDVRVGRALVVTPYAGYSKHETVLGGINTGGVTAGIGIGKLW